ncbi:uncharacterized protein NECHADRAFT_80631 [Fusarium vanettenii 77-13-4]|uniref:Xylanolytic transcriptional activator regulatory domain-containing protein n=1 Tax=Fusarium vanettenii (strain ATCC MYA-4622 / CBS 123669 / FGSC 9596 / NRRL 45880 / 77-13-4) TaxID=660122 RepID=C7YS68_FUSV7|nr:uncharacterized protein NECHADRAFT_80631 [Fusarium vanettenii 77-13-4]EEU45583.1 hypothetical protein NECHADRAFT_80631 [Fusarium vanettenii 77-13-4]
MFSVSQIQQLQQKVADYERQQPATGTSTAQQGSPSQDQGALNGDPPTTRNTGNSPVSDNHLGTRAAETPRSETSAFSLLGQRPPNEDCVPPSTRVPTSRAPRAILPEPSLSSSEIFGTEIRTLLLARSTAGSEKSPAASMAVASPHLDRELIANVRGWPSEEEANQLLELVVLNVGISQHLFDIRSFSDSLSRLYRDTGNETPIRGLWFVQVLFVLAIGKLLRAGTVEDSEVPGVAFFNEAMKHMPAMSDMKKHSILGIEVVGLAALFLQVADRKDEAYLYASMALRLAISHGMHKSTGNGNFSRSEAVHRSRLWWTLYMQERRLAAAGGYPMAIADEAISIGPPTDVAGFASAAAIRVNVRAAQITGRITSTIYVQNTNSETSFIKDIEAILHSLHDVESTMPAEYRMNFSPTGLTVAGILFSDADPSYARTSASLYLSIYQAVIHTVRPILLYMARNVRDRESEPAPNLSPTLRRLGEICVEAARKSLAILQALRNTELIAKNAFLDLDILFSVGFVFVLVEAIQPGRNLGISGIEGSRSVLQYLVTVGNRAAAKRLGELDQMCLHLRPPSQDQQASGQDLPYETANAAAGLAAHTSGSNPDRSGLQEGDQPMDLSNSPMLNAMFPGNGDLANISLQGEDGLYWVYHEPGFVYTGAELADWEALEY